MPFVICFEVPEESGVVSLVGAKNRDSLLVEVLASMRAMLQSVAEEKNLKPERR